MVTAGNRHERRFWSSHLLHLRSGLTSPPCLVPFVFGRRGQWSAGPLPLTRSHQKVALPAPILKAQGRAAGRESARRQGTRAPQSPRASTPSPGHPPASFQRRGGHIWALWPPLSQAGSPDWHSLGAPVGGAGTWRQVADSFLHSHSPSLSPGPRALIPPTAPSRECTRALPGAVAPDALITGLRSGHTALTCRDRMIQPLLKCVLGWVVRVLGL